MTAACSWGNLTGLLCFSGVCVAGVCEGCGLGWGFGAWFEGVMPVPLLLSLKAHNNNVMVG